jgi:hypothetical protein
MLLFSLRTIQNLCQPWDHLDNVIVLHLHGLGDLAGDVCGVEIQNRGVAVGDLGQKSDLFLQTDGKISKMCLI